MAERKSGLPHSRLSDFLWEIMGVVYGLDASPCWSTKKKLARAQCFMNTVWNSRGGRSLRG